MHHTISALFNENKGYLTRKQLPDYPPITLYYWKREYHELGVVKQTINGYTTPIYDLEKSVNDAIKYRTKTGLNVFAEIFTVGCEDDGGSWSTKTSFPPNFSNKTTSYLCLEEKLGRLLTNVVFLYNNRGRVERYKQPDTSNDIVTKEFLLPFIFQ